LLLSLDEWQRAEILSVQVKKIKRDEDARCSSEEQVFEDWPTFSVDAGNLAIEHSRFNLQMFGDPGGEFSEAVEGVSFRETNSPLPSCR